MRQSDIPIYSNDRERLWNCQCSTLIHTLVYWYLLLLKRRIWERQFLDMNQQSLWQCLPMIDIETHKECCLGTSMFTVSHGSIVLQTHAKSMSCFLKCVNSKDLSGSTGTPHQRCQTELCPSHQFFIISMDPWSTNDQRLNLAAVTAQVWCLHPSKVWWMGHLENTEHLLRFNQFLGGQKPPASCVQVGGSSWSVRSGRFDPESQGHPFHGYELCPTRL